ncbi:MAG: C10 family peptidase [Muribaculaceae bacterium]|nr:C10 family peptidase [Muribaculaceae bacterium]
MKAVGTTMLIAVPLLSANASSLTPEEALQRLKGSGSMSRMPGKTSNFILANTETSGDNPMLYVFNRGNQGFVIASADDEMPALLGYSDCGAFDFADASPELKWWLGQYAGEAAFYLEKGVATSVSAMSKTPARADRVAIPELLTSRWNQGEPYNLDCPVYGNERSVTGCIATAMAQVIRYHGYPAQGSGQHSYNYKGQILSFDYGSTTFNYADMLDYYEEDATPAQQQAVASLMYACGVSVNMSYSSSESLAGDMYIPYALKTFFNYDAGTRLLNRSSFTTEEWEDMVYEELAADRPVIYGGQAPDGGHEFVCDGYENGYFHINWGWSGMGNGYFLLSALDPGLQGIGGFSGGYNTDQSMIAGAIPSQGGQPWYPIYATGSMVVTDVYDNNTMAYVNFKNDEGMYNYSPESVTLSFCLKAVSESGEEFIPERSQQLTFYGATGLNVSGYTGIPIGIPDDLAPGNYRTYMVFKTPEGNWQDLLFPLSMTSYANLSVSEDGKYEFTEGSPAVKAEIKVTAFAPQTTVMSGVPTRFNLTVENIGDVEFSNVISIKVFEKGSRTEELAENRIMLSVATGEVFNGYVDITYSLPDGEYDVVVLDPYGDEVSDVFTLKIGEVPVEVERIVLDVTDAGMDVDDTLQLSATVLPEDASDKSIVWSSSNPEIANVDQTGLVTAFTPGIVIITVKAASNEEISTSCQITVKEKVVEAVGVVLDRTEATLTEGDTLTLTAIVDPAETTDKTLTWTSSDAEVATVDEGVVTALKPGTATITVSTVNGKEAKCVITVDAKVIYVSSVTLDKTELAAEEGTSITLVATVLPEDATDKTLLWSSSDEEVATVDQTGVVMILKEGTAVITAASTDGSDIKAVCSIFGTSGVTAILNGTAKADVYTVNGLLLKANADGEYVSNLEKGTYILKTDNRTYKIVK